MSSSRPIRGEEFFILGRIGIFARVLVKNALCPGIRAAGEGGPALTCCRPAPSRVTAAGSFLLEAQAVSSIFLNFTTIPWFPRLPGAAPSERDLTLNWSAVIFILHRGVREPAASLCLGNPYTPALKPHPVDFPYCAAPTSHGGSVCLSVCSMRIIHTWCLVSKQEQYGSGSCKNFC